jgi:hypothetical protein
VRTFETKVSYRVLEDLITELGLDRKSTEAYTLEHLFQGMRSAAAAMESAAHWITSSMDGVEKQFAKESWENVILNSLGELQSNGASYDVAVGKFMALKDQAEALVAHLRRQKEEGKK